jgi:hypothetical protein
MDCLFHPKATEELTNYINYYNKIQDGLGLDFAKEIYLTIQNIISFPNAWPIFSENTRRCLTNRFPYGIVYQIKDKMIFIIAIMHLNRKPDYWKERNTNTK